MRTRLDVISICARDSWTGVCKEPKNEPFSERRHQKGSNNICMEGHRRNCRASMRSWHSHSSPLLAFPVRRFRVLLLFVTVILITELSTSFLLLILFPHACTWSLLILGVAYLYSGLMSCSQLLTLPGAVLIDRPLVAVSPQTTAWTFITWVNGFAFLTFPLHHFRSVVQGPTYRRSNVRRAQILESAEGCHVAGRTSVLSRTVYRVEPPPLFIAQRLVQVLKRRSSVPTAPSSNERTGTAQSLRRPSV
jgi:hypothetical protein